MRYPAHSRDEVHLLDGLVWNKDWPSKWMQTYWNQSIWSDMLYFIQLFNKCVERINSLFEYLPKHPLMGTWCARASTRRTWCRCMSNRTVYCTSQFWASFPSKSGFNKNFKEIRRSTTNRQRIMEWDKQTRSHSSKQRDVDWKKKEKERRRSKPETRNRTRTRTRSKVGKSNHRSGYKIKCSRSNLSNETVYIARGEIQSKLTNDNTAFPLHQKAIKNFTK